MTNPDSTTGKRSTIRNPLMLLTILPALAMGGAWLANTTTAQANSDRDLVLNGAKQITNAFGQRLVDLQETTGLSLQDQNTRSVAQVRATETLSNSSLPITNIAVIDTNKDVLVAYNKNIKNLDPNDPRVIKAWKTQNSTITKAVAEISQRTFDDLDLATNGFVGEINVDGKPITMITSTVPGGEAVVVTTVDTNYVKQAVEKGIQTNILFIAGSLIISLLAGSYVTGRLISRIKKLDKATEQISEGKMEVQIPQDGNDELSVLGQSIERLKETLKIGLERLT